ncbi:MAG TPA: hypothetical protein VEP90_20835, partial [Methylomirabilota bacterium]|nr:hypothetical protein [Methylomirabilota bacterium]
QPMRFRHSLVAKSCGPPVSIRLVARLSPVLRYDCFSMARSFVSSSPCTFTLVTIAILPGNLIKTWFAHTVSNACDKNESL